jgi:hypothetical protein
MSSRRIGVDGCAVGVQGRQHQVAGHRGAHADLGGLGSRISPTRTTSGSCRSAERSTREAQVDLLVHLHLVESGKPILDRILDGDDLAVSPRVERGQRRIQRRGLARAGGPGDQDDADGRAMARCKRSRTRDGMCRRSSSISAGVLRQQAHHDRLAELRRHDRDAHVEGTGVAHLHVRSARPAAAAFGDVEARRSASGASTSAVAILASASVCTCSKPSMRKRIAQRWPPAARCGCRRRASSALPRTPC